MQPNCNRCTQDVLFTFLSVVAGPRSTRLLRPRWARNTRYLTTDVEISSKESQSSQSIIHCPRNASDIVISPRRRAVDITAWKEQRASVFGKKTDTAANIQATEKQDVTSPKVADQPEVAASSTAPTTRRQKDRWRNRRDAIARPTAERRKNEAVNQMVEQATTITKPKKDRWRNRPKADDATNTGTTTSESLRAQRSTKSDSTVLPKILRDFAKPAKSVEPEEQVEPWRIQKEAIKRKLDGAAWNPLKKLSPDAMRGVKQLHAEDSNLWSTENLAKHFEISPDAIRRILKSKWEPTDVERQKQEERWVKRGETIWDRYVELGKKAPRRWRGLDPMPAPKRVTPREKTESKPEEWSQDQPNMSADDGSEQDLSLAHRIL